LETLWAAVGAVFDPDERSRYRLSAQYNIPSEWGTAVNVQAMVYGKYRHKSGSGVAFTRTRQRGRESLLREFLINAQGEDVVVECALRACLATQELPAKAFHRNWRRSANSRETL